MTVPFSTCSRAQFQFIFQLSILNSICHPNYPNSLGSSPAVPHYKPKSCSVLGTSLCHSHRGDAESHQIQLNCFASNFPIISFLFRCLASSTVFQTLSMNRQNTDTKNDPVRRGRPLVRVSSPHELVLTSPMAPEGALSFTTDLGSSFHTSVALAAHLVRRQPGLS